jgi:hypothetical protein
VKLGQVQRCFVLGEVPYEYVSSFDSHSIGVINPPLFEG